MKQFKKPLLILTLALIAQPLWADLVMNSSVSDVYFRGTHEQAGQLSGSITDDDFTNVSPEEPLYIEFGLEKGTRIGCTLVDLNADDPSINTPIYLALSVVGDIEGVTVHAPRDTAAIVRWVAGEDKIWVRFQRDSDTWLSRDGGDTTFGPNSDTRVNFSIGTDAYQTWLSNARFGEGQANMPGNSRNLEASAEADMISTLICLDLSQSTIASSGIDSIINYIPISRDEGPEANPTQDSGINISCDCRIARGFDRDVRTEVIDEGPGVLEPSVTDNYLMLTQDLIIQPRNNPDTSNYLAFDFNSGTTVVIEAPEGAGFAEDAAQVLGDCVAEASVNLEPDSIFNADEGLNLYRRITVLWPFGFKRMDENQIHIKLKLHYPNNMPREALEVDWTLQLRKGGSLSELRDAPFNGPEQQRLCPQIPYAISDTWLPSPLSTRDRAITHITRPGQGFSTQITLANPTNDPRAYRLSGYDEAGNHLGDRSGSLDGGKATTILAETLLNDAALSHLILSGDSQVSLSARYRADGEDKAAADVYETRTRARSWRLESGDGNLTFDGVAVVNMGNAPTMVLIEELDDQGLIVNSTTIAEALSAKGKLLHVLTQTAPGSWFRVSADQDLMITALRGTQDGTYLWENPATPTSR